MNDSLINLIKEKNVHLGNVANLLGLRLDVVEGMINKTASYHLSKQQERRVREYVVRKYL